MRQTTLTVISLLVAMAFGQSQALSAKDFGKILTSNRIFAQFSTVSTLSPTRDAINEGLMVSGLAGKRDSTPAVTSKKTNELNVAGNVGVEQMCPVPAAGINSVITNGIWYNSVCYMSLQAAVNAASSVGAGRVIVPTSVNIGTTTLTLPSDVSVEGPQGQAVSITYTGTGIAVDARGASSCGWANIGIVTTNDAATALAVGNGSYHCNLDRVSLMGVNDATNTGTGLLLDASTGWSYHLDIPQPYILGYKYGIHVVGASTSNTWTSITARNVSIIGRSAGIIPGSIGIWFDSNTNGTGTVIDGGSIEGFAVPFQCDGPCAGISVTVDMEANTVNDPVLSSSFNGFIKHLDGGSGSLEVKANGSSYRWYIEAKHWGGLLGRFIRESRYGMSDVCWDDNSGACIWGYYRGASLFLGGTPTPEFTVTTGTSGNPWYFANWIRVFGQKQIILRNGSGTGVCSAPAYAPSQAASSGEIWNVGDIAWCGPGTAAVGQPVGFVNTVAGTTTTAGTWQPFGLIGTAALTAQLPLVASLTTTGAGSDNVTIATTASSHCALTATNSSAAANIATTYISGKGTNYITVTHTATSGMTYDIVCTPN
jgi:hypothetical protein